MSVDYQTEPLDAEDAPPSRFSVSGYLVAELLESAVDTVRRLTEGGVEGVAATSLVSLVGSLEELKRASCAAQARLTHDFREVREAEATDGGHNVEKALRAAGAEIALARREPTIRANRLIDFAQALLMEMPNTLAALNAGLISEWAATLVVKETAVLSPEDRHAVDVSLAEHFGTCRDGRLGGLARAMGMTLDPESHARRLSKAMDERNVTCRPAPDTMGYLTALLPVADAVAAEVALSRAADEARAAGDPRTRGQVMADTLVERLTGRRASRRHPDSAEGAGGTESGGTESGGTESGGTESGGTESGGAESGGADTEPSGTEPTATEPTATEPTATGPSAAEEPRASDADETVAEGPETCCCDGRQADPESSPTKPADLALNLVLSGEALFSAGGPAGESKGPVGTSGGYDNVAFLNGEPIPAWLARDLICDPDTKVRLRRIFTHPETGQLIAMDSRATHFDDGLRRLVRQRDQRCRLCDGPIRHIDHIRPRRSGGPTSAINGQGLCEFCNYLKESPGWRQETVPDPDHPTASPVVKTRTPGGHTYYSRAPSQLPTLRRHPRWRPAPRSPRYWLNWNLNVPDPGGARAAPPA